MRLRFRRVRRQDGFTLSEMLVVLAILGIVVGALVQLFVSASRAEVDMSNRFRAQQDGRLALDALRREIHCASALSSTQTGGAFPTTQILITPGSSCSTGTAPVTWCTRNVSTGRYELRRVVPALVGIGAACTGGVAKADHLTTGLVFTAYPSPVTGERRKLSISLPVDVDPTTTIGTYLLQDDIVLRNTSR